MRRKPPFASGKIGGDYEPLFYYWEVAREAGREDLVESSMISEDDYRLVRELAGRISVLGELLDILVERMHGRIDPEMARIAYRRYGLDVTGDDARLLLARLLASWLIEAAEYWGYIRLKG